MELPNFVYRLYGESNNLLYVGLTRNVGMRMSQHSMLKEWWPEVTRMEVDQFPSRREAAKAEVMQIRTLFPVHNILGFPPKEKVPKYAEGDPGRPSRGRPKLDNPRNKNVVIRITEAEHELITLAAKACGKSISEMGREDMVLYANERIQDLGDQAA